VTQAIFQKKVYIMSAYKHIMSFMHRIITTLENDQKKFEQIEILEQEHLEAIKGLLTIINNQAGQIKQITDHNKQIMDQNKQILELMLTQSS